MRKFITILVATLVAMVAFTSCEKNYKFDGTYHLDKESLTQTLMANAGEELDAFSAAFASVFVSSMVNAVDNRFDFTKDGRVVITLNNGTVMCDTTYTATKDSVFFNGISFKKDNGTLVSTSDDGTTLIYIKD